jgi:hypothetical protein
VIEKKCACCGQPFSCQQKEGCWCADVRLTPSALAELQARFAGCLCEACLRSAGSEGKMPSGLLMNP